MRSPVLLAVFLTGCWPYLSDPYEEYVDSGLVDTDTTVDDGTDADTEPDTDADTEPDTDPDTEPDTDPDTEPDTDPDTEPDTDPDTEPDTDPDTSPTACPDPYEPNNTRAMAPALNDSATISASICPSDPADWYRASRANEGCLWEADITSSTIQDLELTGYYPTGVPLVSVTTSPLFTTSYVRMMTEWGGPSWSVTSYMSDQVDYTLSHQIICDAFPSCPDDDPFEPNDNPTQALPTGWTTNFNAAICGQGEDDYFLIPARPGCSVTVDVFFAHSDMDIDAYLANEDFSVTAESTSVTDNESLTAPLDHDMYLRINAWSVTVPNDYRVEITNSCDD